MPITILTSTPTDDNIMFIQNLHDAVFTFDWFQKFIKPPIKNLWTGFFCFAVLLYLFVLLPSILLYFLFWLAVVWNEHMKTV